MRTILKFFIFGLSCALACGCASSQKWSDAQKADYTQWYKEVRIKVETLWKKTLKADVKKYIHSSEKYGDFTTALPKLDSRISATVAADGSVLAVKKLRQSPYDFLDDAGIIAVMNSSPLPAPPASLLKNGVAQMTWDFKITEKPKTHQ